jgi:hypothetical protein
MKRPSSRLRGIFIVALLCVFVARGYGQDARLQLANLDKLSEKAAKITDLTLDGSLLAFAAKIIDSADDGDKDVVQIKSILKSLKGIYIKSFEFDEAGQYSKADVDAIRSQLTSPRWSKIIQDVDKRTNQRDEIYLLKDGEHVGGVVILVAEPKELTVVNIVGDVAPDKIAALERHFVPDQKKSGGHKQKKEVSHDDE